MKILFTSILVLFLYAELHSQWVLQNPLTYQTDLTSVYFIDQNKGYAISNYGRLFQTSDGGISWGSSCSQSDSGNFNSLFITGNPSVQGILGYAVGEGGTISKIVNVVDYPWNFPGFKRLTSGVIYSLNSLFFTSPQIGYCCGNSGTILKTTDAGTTWTKLTSGTTYSLSSIYFTDSNTGYAAGGTNTNHVGIILKTTDAGSTWKVQYSGQSNRYLYSIHFENITTGFACGWNGTILKTTNGGTNWVLQTSNVTSQLRSISFSTPQTGAAVGSNGTIIGTTNGGTNWIKVQSNTTEQLNSVVTPGSNSAVIAGSMCTVFTVNNAGTGLQQHIINNEGYSYVNFKTKDIGFIVDSGLLYKTTNEGQTWLWKKLPAQSEINEILFLDTKNGWVNSGNTVFKTTDGGETWVENYKYTSATHLIKIFSFYFTDINNGWFAAVKYLNKSDINDNYNHLLIYHTTNGGKVWNDLDIPFVDLTGYYDAYEILYKKIYFKNKNEGWLIGYYDPVELKGQFPLAFHTTDGGKTWNRITLFGAAGHRTELDLCDILFTDNQTGYLFGSHFTTAENWEYLASGVFVAKTTDGGVSWKQRDYFYSFGEDYPSLKSGSFPTASVGYAGGYSGIIKTTDGGITWMTQKLPADITVNDISFTDADNGWAVGNGGILKHQKEAVTPAINWSAYIKFENNEDNWPGKILYDSLTFGQNSNATNGLDSKLGETDLPPLPPEGTFDARFIMPDDQALTSFIDFRNSNEKGATWTINLQYKDFPLKISWSSGYPLNTVPGEFYLYGQSNTDWLWLNMKDTSQVILNSLPGFNSLKILYYSPEQSLTSILGGQFHDNWNLISIPLYGVNMTKENIFEYLGGNIFGYDGKYYNADILENGKGYWAKLGLLSNDFFYYGARINKPIKIKKGWNLIGPFDLDISIDKVSTQPAGILTTPFYGFNNGYFSASILNPGQGYWVKASSDGVINYNETGLYKVIEPLAANQSNLGKIIITDNSGISTALYDVIDKTVNLKQYEMPPLPPSGIFDARYNSGLMAERLDGDGKAIILNSVSYPVTIKAEGIDLRLSYSVNGTSREEVILQNGNSYTITESSVRVVEVKRTAERIIPKQFALHQNYPNPFNPRTKIKYDLPEKSKVNLSVYNILGERIAELVNGEIEAGYHEVEFNGNSLSSGVYIYRIDTDKDHLVKKMLMLK